MEEKTGCVRRSQEARKAVHKITAAASQLASYPDKAVSALADEIIHAAQGLEE